MTTVTSPKQSPGTTNGLIPADPTQQVSAPPVPQPVGLDVADAVSASLVRRGYLTTEWFTTIIGLALTLVLAWVGVKGSVATQIVSVVAPTVLAAIYAVVRTRQKTTLAQLATDLFPQFDASQQP